LRHTDGYTLRVIPLRFNGNFHLHYYPTLAHELQKLRPHIVHMDEEPYNLATWLGLRAAGRMGAVGTFFTWQNLYRSYPPPFRWLEQQSYLRAPIAIAGNHDAAAVLQRKGFGGAITIIPQFGVDPVLFSPSTSSQPQRDCCHIGYAGGLLPEKGVDLLLRACAGLQGSWQLSIAGEGSEQVPLQKLAATLGIAERVTWVGKVDSEAMADFYRTLDLFVLPSRTQPNWKEQFGRVLIEAMACAVCVVGSDSGEIPNVIGEAGVVVPEKNVEQLRVQLQGLLDNAPRRYQLGAAGRTRVLHNYTMAAVAEATLDCYERLYALCK
ncbi:MAG: glycosyltransferase family 4 protein, partial [Caldilineaceae bacterium]|nr:glycosyltransferase family 4 protein [Caldilineaceae bacterium]